MPHAVAPSTVDAASAAVEALRRGSMAVVCDVDEHVAVLVLGAAHATADRLHALTRLGAGWSYLVLTDERCRQLGLEPISASDDGRVHAHVTMTIASGDGGHGIGSDERARTVAVAIDPTAGRDAIRPGGHVMPLRARPAGVLERAGHAEAALDLVQMTGAVPAAVIVELIDDDGTAMQGSVLHAFAREHGLPLVSIGDVVDHRRRHDRGVERVAEATIATTTGTYRAHGYLVSPDGSEHVALVHGDVEEREDVLVYLHAACWQGDVFRSRLCDCRLRLDAATAAIGAAACGVIVHLAHPDYARHPEWLDEDRACDAARILSDLRVASIRVLADDEAALEVLDGYGLAVSGRMPLLR